MTLKQYPRAIILTPILLSCESLELATIVDIVHPVPHIDDDKKFGAVMYAD